MCFVVLSKLMLLQLVLLLMLKLISLQSVWEFIFYFQSQDGILVSKALSK